MSPVSSISIGCCLLNALARVVLFTTQDPGSSEILVTFRREERMESRSFNIPDSIIHRCIAVTEHLTETLYGRRGVFGVRGQRSGVVQSTLWEGWCIHGSSSTQQRCDIVEDEKTGSRRPENNFPRLTLNDPLLWARSQLIKVLCCLQNSAAS